MSSSNCKWTSNLQSQVPNPLCSPIAWLPPCSQGLLLSGKPTPIHSLPVRPEKWPKHPNKKIFWEKKSLHLQKTSSSKTFSDLSSVFWFSDSKMQKKISAQKDTKTFTKTLEKPGVSTALPHPKDNSPPESGESETRIYTSEFQGELNHLGVWEFQDCEFFSGEIFVQPLTWDVFEIFCGRPILQLW